MISNDFVEKLIRRDDWKIVYTPEIDMFDHVTDSTFGEMDKSEVAELISILTNKISVERFLKEQYVSRFDFKEEKIRAIIRVLKLLDGTEYSITISHLADVLEWFIGQFCYQDLEVNRRSEYGSPFTNKIEIKPLSKKGKRLIDGVTYTWEHDVLSYLEHHKFYDELTKEKCDNTSNSKRKPLSNALRVKILDRDDYKCQMCGATVKDGAKLHIDHIVPVSKGGKDVESNLQVLCSDCNHGKYNKDYLKHDKRKLAELEGK